MAWDARNRDSEAREHSFDKWMTAYVATTVLIPVGFVVFGQNVGGNLVGLWMIGFFSQSGLSMLTDSDARRTARVARLVLLALGLACLAVGIGAFLQLLRAC